MNFDEWISRERRDKPKIATSLFDAWQAALDEAWEVAVRWEYQALTPEGKLVAKAIADTIRARKSPL